MRALIPAISLLFISLVISCSYSQKTSAKMLKKAESQQFDLVIISGAPFDTLGWSRLVKARVYWAKYLYDKGIAQNLMFSGSAVYTPYSEAEVMAMYAEAIGIPKAHIYVETHAEHSTENVYYSYHKAKKLGFKKIAFASDPFQTRMLKRFIRKRISPDIRSIPFVFDTLKSLEPGMTDPKIDFSKAYKADFKSIMERETFRQRFRGTRGKSIKPGYSE